MSNIPTVRFLDRSTPPHIVTLILIAGISALNMSIFLPSLTAMTDYFQTDYATMQFSLSGYLAMTAVLQIFIGPVSDKIGRRPVVIGSMMIFVLASIGTYFATSITVFLVFRMLQAAVATGLVLSRAVVRDMVPQNQAASMIGYVTMGMALVPMVGPMIGGALDELFGWHATFLFLTICGVGVLAISYFDQGETLTDGGMSFHDQLRSYPELFASPRFWGYALCAAFASGAFFALLGGASFIAGTVFGLSPVVRHRLGRASYRLCDGQLSFRAIFSQIWDQQDGNCRDGHHHRRAWNVTGAGACRHPASANFLWVLQLSWTGERDRPAQRHRRLAVGSPTSGRHRVGAWQRIDGRRRGGFGAICQYPIKRRNGRAAFAVAHV